MNRSFVLSFNPATLERVMSVPHDKPLIDQACTFKILYAGSTWFCFVFFADSHFVSVLWN